MIKKIIIMKKIIGILLLAVIVLSCSKDSEAESKFNYDLNLLYGTWRITHIQNDDGSFMDITTSAAESLIEPTYATFKSDFTYTGKGFFGNGNGKYKAVGNSVITYVDGVEFLRYDIVSLTGTECQLIIKEPGTTSSIGIKCKKQ